MPYEVTWERGGVACQYADEVTGRELVESVLEMTSDARFDDARHAIADFSSARIGRASPNELTEVSALQLGAAISNPRVIFVMVAADNAVRVAIDGLKASEIMPERYRHFASASTAREWLAARRSGRT